MYLHCILILFSLLLCQIPVYSSAEEDNQQQTSISREEEDIDEENNQEADHQDNNEIGGINTSQQNLLRGLFTPLTQSNLQSSNIAERQVISLHRGILKKLILLVVIALPLRSRIRDPFTRSRGFFSLPLLASLNNSGRIAINISGVTLARRNAISRFLFDSRLRLVARQFSPLFSSNLTRLRTFSTSLINTSVLNRIYRRLSLPRFNSLSTNNEVFQSLRRYTNIRLNYSVASQNAGLSLGLGQGTPEVIRLTYNQFMQIVRLIRQILFLPYNAQYRLFNVILSGTPYQSWAMLWQRLDRLDTS